MHEMIKKMYEANKRKLTKKQVKRGLARYKIVLNNEGSIRTTWIEREKRWHCLMWVYRKKPFKCTIIARKAKEKNHAIAKCALAAPIKRWSLT